ncbi:hypothetical protein [uncultured Chryseobacterium sp.]|uniref:hypothetical protein n=1 Tax=uncultured Chryseobacterium sp. TaxID=259322 RepID=UPI0025D7D746|nr:hypothetical protein [uncultured Chryseobacterium sp.]
MKNWEFYKEELDKLREELENGNYDAEQAVNELHEKIEIALEQSFDKGDKSFYEELIKEIEAMKKEFDFYDSEGELDMMFPNRADDDFDDDSMNIFDND